MTPTATPATYGRDASVAQFSVARYQRMIEAGILTPDDKVELLENYVVLKMPRNPLHDGTIEAATETFGALIPSGWRLRVQLTIVLPDSQPEPDLAIVRGDRTTFRSRHPGPQDVGLIVEVADSSLLRDRHDKTRIYARAGIACYWVVNLLDRRVEVFTHPSGPTAVPAYQSYQVYQPGDAVPLILDGSTAGTLAVTDLLS